MVKKRPEEYSPDELEPVVCDMDEQETSIVRGRQDDKWSLWVCDNTMLTKVKKVMKKSPKDYKLVSVQWDKDGNPTGYEFEVSKNCISLRTSAPEMTEEQKAAAAERMKALREKMGADKAE